MAESTELYTVMSKIGKDIKEIKEIFKEFVISLKALVIHTTLQEERRAEALNPSLEYIEVEEEVEVLGNVEEDLLQDLTNVVVMAQTPKAILAVKNGYQKWVAFSHIIPRDEVFKLGTLYENIELLKTSEWVLKKPWEKFKPQKKGG